MGNLGKRLEELEATKAKQGGKRHVLRLPDNGRGPFRVFTPYQDRVKTVPNSRSTWQDGSRVFDSLSDPPSDGTYKDLTDRQWAELRASEPRHQRKESE